MGSPSGCLGGFRLQGPGRRWREELCQARKGDPERGGVPDGSREHRQESMGSRSRCSPAAKPGSAKMDGALPVPQEFTNEL